MISKFMWPLIGGVFGVAVVVIATWLAGYFFGPLYHSDEDMNRNAMIFLMACLILMAIGALVGFRIQRNLTRRSSGRS